MGKSTLLNIIEHIEPGIVILNQDMSVSHINRMFMLLFTGVSREQLFLGDILNFHKEESRRKVSDMLRLATDLKRQIPLSLKIIRNDGQDRYLLVKLTPLVDREMADEKICALFYDPVYRGRAKADAGSGYFPRGNSSHQAGRNRLLQGGQYLRHGPHGIRRISLRPLARRHGKASLRRDVPPYSPELPGQYRQGAQGVARFVRMYGRYWRERAASPDQPRQDAGVSGCCRLEVISIYPFT
jgi:hypothetical protein